MSVGRWIGPGPTMGWHSFTPNEKPEPRQIRIKPGERIVVRDTPRRVTRRLKK